MKHCQSSDIKGMYDLFSQEGCNKSENKFSNEQECIFLDGIQERIARNNKTDKKASADFLICVNDNKVLLADAKFRVRNIENVERSSLNSKIDQSRVLIESDDYMVENKLFIVYSKKILTPQKANRLSSITGNSPRFHFLTAEQFRGIFE